MNSNVDHLNANPMFLFVIWWIFNQWTLCNIHEWLQIERMFMTFQFGGCSTSVEVWLLGIILVIRKPEISRWRIIIVYKVPSVYDLGGIYLYFNLFESLKNVLIMHFKILYTLKENSIVTTAKYLAPDYTRRTKWIPWRLEKSPSCLSEDTTLMVDFCSVKKAFIVFRVTKFGAWILNLVRWRFLCL